MNPNKLRSLGLGYDDGRRRLNRRVVTRNLNWARVISQRWIIILGCLLGMILLNGSLLTARGQGYAWIQNAAGPGDDFARGIAVDDAGNTFLTGDFEGTCSFGRTNLTSNGARDIFLAKYDRQGILLWVRQAGGSGDDYGKAAAIDSRGNCYVTGSFQETARFGTINVTVSGNVGVRPINNVFIAKYDSAGNLVWVAKLAGNYVGVGEGILADNSGQAYVTGSMVAFNGETSILVAKLASSGDTVWVRTTSSPPGASYGTHGKAIALDQAGNIFVTGLVGLFVDFGIDQLRGTFPSFFLAKYDGAGSCRWVRGASTSWYAAGTGVTVDSNGNVYAAGYFQATLSFGTNTLVSSSPTINSPDYFLAKYDGSGNLLWTTNDTREGVVAVGLAGDGSGNTHMAGYLSPAAPFVAKFDSMGRLLWRLRPGPAIATGGSAVAVDKSGDAYFAGYYGTGLFFDTLLLTNVAALDIFLAKVSERLPPSIVLQPKSQTVLAGTGAKFVSAARSLTPVTYQWQFNGIPTEGATNTVLTLTNVQAASAGNYVLTASNVYGVSISDPAGLTVTPSPPVIVTPYTGRVVAVRTDVNLGVTVRGSEPFGYQWQFNGSKIDTATNASLVLRDVSTNNAGIYTVVVSNAVGTNVSAPIALTVLPIPTSLMITNGLVLHLKFDGDYLDYSGRNNHGTNVRTRAFSNGRIGSNALHYSTGAGTNNYVTLGLRPDLQFSSNVNFSVGFWVRLPVNSLQGDLPFICNAVNSTYTPGYTFAPSYQLGGWAWSLYDKSSGAGVGVYGANGSINDGEWHHLVHTFDRNGNGVSYLDGVQVDSRSVSGTGNIDTGKSTTIGQDPTGGYPEAGEGDLDDIGVWRRGLSSVEVAEIYLAGATTGLSFVSGSLKLALEALGERLQLAWPVGVLQSADDLTGPYTDMPTASSPQDVTPSVTKKFYRIRL